MAEIASGGWRHKEPPEIRGTGYCVGCVLADEGLGYDEIIERLATLRKREVARSIDGPRDARAAPANQEAGRIAASMTQCRVGSLLRSCLAGSLTFVGHASYAGSRSALAPGLQPPSGR